MQYAAEAEAAALEAAKIPAGMRIMPEEERQQTLSILATNKAAVEGKIMQLPFNIETPSQVPSIPSCRIHPHCARQTIYLHVALLPLTCLCSSTFKQGVSHHGLLALNFQSTSTGLLHLSSEFCNLSPQIKYKQGLEARLQEIEEAERLFSRPNVLVHI